MIRLRVLAAGGVLFLGLMFGVAVTAWSGDIAAPPFFDATLGVPSGCTVTESRRGAEKDSVLLDCTRAGKDATYQYYKQRVEQGNFTSVETHFNKEKGTAIVMGDGDHPMMAAIGSEDGIVKVEVLLGGKEPTPIPLDEFPPNVGRIYEWYPGAMAFRVILMHDTEVVELVCARREGVENVEEFYRANLRDQGFLVSPGQSTDSLSFAYGVKTGEKAMAMITEDDTIISIVLSHFLPGAEAYNLDE